MDFHGEKSQLFLSDRDHRGDATAITHGFNYGRGAAAIAQQTGTSIAATEGTIAAYSTRYPEVRRWQDELRRRAEQGRMLSTGTGREVQGDRDKAHTTAPARAAQAGARDLAMTGLLRLVDAGLQPRLRLFLHDEVVLSVPEDEAVDVTAQVLNLMSFDWASPTGLVVPGVAHEAESSGPRWSDLYSRKGAA